MARGDPPARGDIFRAIEAALERPGNILHARTRRSAFNAFGSLPLTIDPNETAAPVRIFA